MIFLDGELRIHSKIIKYYFDKNSQEFKAVEDNKVVASEISIVELYRKLMEREENAS
jgi:hypothetical protein